MGFDISFKIDPKHTKELEDFMKSLENRVIATFEDGSCEDITDDLKYKYIVDRVLGRTDTKKIIDISKLNKAL